MRKIVLLASITLLIFAWMLPQDIAEAVVARTRASGFGAIAHAAVPTDPSDLVVTQVSSSSISISWTDNSSDEDGFKIERCAGANCTDFQLLATMPANVSNITDWGLAKNKTYKYRVQAYNVEGNSGYSNIVAGTTTR